MTPQLHRNLKPLFLERAPGTLRTLLGFQWFIALQKRTPDLRLGQKAFFLQAPGSSSWADPFLATVGGRTFVLFENYHYLTQHGRIECIELDPEGNVVRHEIVLDRPYHISYPFLFTWQGAHFMMPETVAAGRVEVYLAEDFPWKWKLHRVIMPGVRAADSTMVEHDGQYWLFQTVEENLRERLYLHRAPSPFGPWKPHPKNPVVDSLASGRCGGSLVTIDGALVRPAQDSTGWYGRLLRLMRVDRLNEFEYAESEIGTLEPDRRAGVHGLHTYNRSGDWEIWDGAQYGCLPHVVAERAIRTLRTAGHRLAARLRNGDAEDGNPSRSLCSKRLVRGG